MDKSAIILAGGSSSRFGQDKGLLPLLKKPLIKHVLSATNGIVDETIIVVSSESQAENFAKVVDSNVNIVVDIDDVQSPLIGASTGFRKTRGEYSLLLPCDTPLVSTKILLLLFELCTNRNAVIPRWPNGYIEPLQAVYRTKPALEAAESALSEGKFDMRFMVDRLGGVRYISTLVLQQLDPKLRTFFNVNTSLDLKKAESMLKHTRSMFSSLGSSR
ncbi:MAG: molybdenum cofactor guanylyltransferase [Candidatus Bathyarchaeota archaeon]|nr:molybdenum cofactor guanylyltransferase [Candidatus Bathyarchaeota archaeon]MDH5747493.1 molybdenum cofactor guanylyltransferase [Candidatus Bathyarchaeota archaeon]